MATVMSSSPQHRKHVVRAKRLARGNDLLEETMELHTGTLASSRIPPQEHWLTRFVTYLQRDITESPATEEGVGDADLIAAALRGDGAAQAALHDRYAPMVHGIVLTRVPASEAEDVVQNVFVLAFGQLATLRDGGAFGAWIAVIARRAAARFYRHRRSHVALSAEIAAPTADDNLRAEALVVLSVIQSLPEAYRETLVLRLVEGLTGPQIARCTGLTEGSVRVNLHRGMSLLRESLQHEMSSTP